MRSEPPAIKTLPLTRRVAECPERAVVMLPVAVTVPRDCAIKEAVWPASPQATTKRRYVRVGDADNNYFASSAAFLTEGQPSTRRSLLVTAHPGKPSYSTIEQRSGLPLRESKPHSIESWPSPAPHLLESGNSPDSRRQSLDTRPLR